MIEKTVFTNKLIVDIIKEKYNVEVSDIKKINRGSANLYSLNKDTYVLKEFQSKYTKEEIDKEIKVINHLINNDVSVPEYICTVDNEYSFIFNGKVITLQKYLEGYTMESNTANYEQMIESAKELGKIVKSLETLNFELPKNDVTSWYSIEVLNEGVEKHEDLINKANGEAKDKIICDLKDKLSMLNYIIKNFNFEEMKNLTIKNTHGDYSVLQFIYKDEKISSIIDFVSACKMPIVWEIIRSYSYIDIDSKNGEINIDHLIDYVKEFTKYVKLNEYDIKYMSYLYLIQLLTSTFGYKQYINDNTKIDLLDFAYFRTNLCKHLFKNANFIAEKLKKEILDIE